MAGLTDDELDTIKECFDIFDKIGDGKVESFQIIDVLRACGLNPLTADVKKMIETSDIKGRVDLDTLCGIYEQVKGAPGQATFEDMKEAFKTYDRDNSGTLSAAQLRQVLVLIGDSLKEDEADVIVGKFEESGGAINYESMIKALIA